MSTISSPRNRRFTIIELLVVIGIIMILAAMLIPVFQQARAQARKTSCLNQMRQFGQTIASYRGDYDDRPPLWLSALYPDYLPSKDVYVCPQDDTEGFDGGRHGLGHDNGNDSHTDLGFAEKDKYPDPSIDGGIELKDTFAETDDTSRNDHNRTATINGVYAGGNTAISRSSYMYEFTYSPCSFVAYGDWTWWTIKRLQLDAGLGRGGADDFKDQRNANGDANPDGIPDGVLADHEAWEPYQLPAVRCFQHMGVMWGNREMALNTAYSGEFFYSKYEWEQTFQ